MKAINSVRLLRVTHEQTQAELATLLDIHVSTYTKKENGQIPFSVKEIVILRDYYKLNNDQVAEIFLTNKVG